MKRLKNIQRNVEEEQIEKDKYRFSGYRLPMLCLDETGESYIICEPHPDYNKLPPTWQTRKATWKTL